MPFPASRRRFPGFARAIPGSQPARPARLYRRPAHPRHFSSGSVVPDRGGGCPLHRSAHPVHQQPPPPPNGRALGARNPSDGQGASLRARRRRFGAAGLGQKGPITARAERGALPDARGISARAEERAEWRGDEPSELQMGCAALRGAAACSASSSTSVTATFNRTLRPALA